MKDAHVWIGAVTVGANALAALVGLVAWLLWRNPKLFWILLRAGQALVVILALDGGLLLLLGEELPPLHLIYGLVPLGVSFVAEQLRATSAQAVLDARGVATARELPAADADAAVLDILLREMGVMAASALVVAALGLRAGGVL